MLDILEKLYNLENMIDSATDAFRHAHEGEAGNVLVGSRG